MDSTMIELHYVERGRGQALVLIPGWAQTTRSFAGQLDGLAAHCRVIALDMRGHGESPKPAHGYRVARLAADLQDFLVAHDLNAVTLAGHSMGAAVIWSYLEQFGAARIGRLVFIDQAPLVTNGCNLDGAALAEAGCAFTPETLYATARALIEDQRATLESLRPAFFTPAVGAADFARAVDESMKLPAAYGARLLVDHASQDWRDVITHLLPALGLPTLIFGADPGTLFPVPAARWIARQIPTAQLSIFHADEGGSHFLFQENPARFNAELVDFMGA
ncbi:MAG: alpha/beta hydrolase [Gammaproteobacteria bacterium]